MRVPLSTEVARWATRVDFEALPADVVAATKLRVLDTIGLTYAGASTDFGRANHAAAAAMSPAGSCQVLGSPAALGPTGAAFANAASSQALEFDDTHNESIVHMSSPSVSAAVALAQTTPVTGRALIVSIAVGNEISCRVGSVALGQFHKRGLHPTGLFAPFGVAYLAGQLLGLDETRMASAAGIAGSFASGLLECWVDGTESKFLHAGWAAQGGITAAMLARNGISGPLRVFEGRFGLFESHLQDPDARIDYSRIRDRLGDHWESRNSSFKPFPAAHVLHPYIDAALRLVRQHRIEADDIEEIRCPVSAFVVPIVCEPVGEKQAPRTTAHGRVSLPYTLAEAICRRGLGRNAYGEESLRDPRILGIATRIRHYVDPGFPGPGQFRGVVEMSLRDGRTLVEVEEHNRGSRENPMSYGELRDKFDDNTRAYLSADQQERFADGVARLEAMADATELLDSLTH